MESPRLVEILSNPPACGLLLCAHRGGQEDFFRVRKECCATKFTNDNFDAESTRSNIEVGLHDLQLTPTMKP